MKKNIFKITMSLAMLLAVAGYSFDGTNDEVVDPVNTTVVDNTCGSCGTCDTCAPEACEPCDSCNTCEPCKTCEPCEPCKPCCTETPKTGEPCTCAYNAPARIDPACGWKAWVTASFIYWQPKMKGLDLGDLVQADAGANNYTISKINLDFDYKPGFKVGAGFSICRDDWTLYLEYTRLNCDNSNSMDLGSDFNETTNYIENGTASLGTTLMNSGFPYRSVKQKWELDYNMFDLELGRPYYLGKKLVFKPHFGMRGGWINHRVNFDGNYQYATLAFADYFARDKLDTWLIGPRAGVKADWMIGCDFKVITNVAGSLTYQNFKPYINVTEPVQAGVTTARSAVVSNEISYLTPNVEFALGLGYGTYFCNKEWYFDIGATYDFHYFWNQNFIRNLDDSIGYLNFPDGAAGDLMLHGLTITARLDF